MTDSRESERSPLPFYASLMAGAGVLGVLGSWLYPNPNDRLGVLLGVGAAVVSGVVGLVFKRRALAVSMQAVMKVLGAVFAVRAVLVVAGLLLSMKRGIAPIAFTVGFFAEYFVLQWIELSYVLAEQRRRQ